MPDTTSDRLKLFVSYSRRDMAAADELVEKLEAEGFEVTIDRRDLPYGEAWQAELADFIRAADTVLWLVSPASAESKWCNWELGEVQRLNKRLLPLMIEALPPEDLPESLGRIHVLPAEGVYDPDQHFDTLVEALNTDRSWLKEHTRLGDRARQWHAKGQRGDLLLRGSALNDAEAWRDRQPKAAPRPSEDILDLILASRRASGRRQRRVVAGSLAIALVAIFLFSSALSQTLVARKTLSQAIYSANEIIALLANRFRHSDLPTPFVNEILSEALALHDDLAEHAVDDTQFLFSRSVALSVIGNTLLDHGETEAAGATLGESLNIMRTLTARDPENLDWQHDLWIALIDIGDFRLQKGDVEDALQAYEESLAIMQTLVVLEPEEMKWRRALASTFEGIGRVRRATGDMDAALQAYLDALAARREVAKREPDNLDRQRDVSVLLDIVGDFRQQSGDTQGALQAHEEGLAIRRDLSERDPGNTKWLHDVYVSQIKIGDVRGKAGDAEGALQAYAEGLAISRDLSQRNPDNTEWRRDVSLSLERIGDVRRQAGDAEGALEAYEETLAIRRDLVARGPDNVSWQTEVVFCLYKMSVVTDGPQRRTYLQEALTITERLAEDGLLTEAQETWLDLFRDELANASQTE